ncbi:MAG: hypothetical protein V7L29_07175 [Nostoc sp.]|uniref:hypothetical protein n=1 Tax=Nostoc sp. TaxID=1180 RepID=UPI002FFA8EF3
MTVASVAWWLVWGCSFITIGWLVIVLGFGLQDDNDNRMTRKALAIAQSHP